MILSSATAAAARLFYRRFCSRTTPSELVFVEHLTKEYSGITTLCMNRQDKKNALGKEFTHQLEQEISQLADAERQVRVLLLRSLVPGVFCAGADLKERLAMSEDEVPRTSEHYRKIFQNLYSLPFPTIAVLDGHALGGGLEMALACDLRIAATSIKIGLVETSLAIMPGAGGTQRLPRLIGIGKAKELIFTAKVLDGKQAHEYGIVNEAVEQSNRGDAAFRRSLEIAKKIAQNGPIGVRAAKEAINKGSEEALLERALEIEGESYQKVVATKDRIEGLRAFAEKRVPNYEGQ